MKHDRLDKILLTTLSYLPNKANLFSANCNKVAASFLYAAAKITATKENKPLQTAINTPTIWSHASSQRMYIWDPLQTSLKQISYELIDRSTVKACPKICKNSLITKKIF